MASPESCPDCGAPLEVIEILDATSSDLRHQAGGHVRLRYTTPDAPADLLSGDVATVGSVEARMCTGCRRVLLYGRPDGS